MDESSWRSALIRNLGGSFSVLNILLGASYPALLAAFEGLRSGKTSANDAVYYLSRAGVRIEDFLGVVRINSVTTDVLARHYQAWITRLDLPILVSVVVAAVLVALLLRLSAERKIHLFVTSLVLWTAPFAIPAACLVRHIWLPRVPSDPWWGIPLVIALVEVIVALGLFLWRSRVSKRTIHLLLLIHYIMWLPAVWVETQYRLLTVWASLVVFLFSGILWWLGFAGPNLVAPGSSTPKSGTKWAVFGAVASISVLVAIWVPPQNRPFGTPKDINAVEIKLSRGRCFGPCPIYSFVIYGNGLVKFDGEHNVRVRGKQTATLSREQVLKVLAELDRINFMRLEDRAFAGCFDTPSVGVSVSVDGRSNEVVSDWGCPGAYSKIQEQFITAAARIDQIAGSDRWVKCENDYCRN